MVDKRQLEQQMQYIKGMQDYTHFIQQHSRDAFDGNFLEQFVGSSNPQINASFPVSMDCRTYDSL